MSFDNPQKTYVREKVWSPTYSAFRGKTLTLPGVECAFEKQLVQSGWRLEEIVAVESDHWLVEPIARFLAGKGRLYIGELANLLAEGHLDDEFGFQVLNLDFCGSPYQLNAKRESKLLSTVATAVRKQREANVARFALLLTGSTIFKAPPSVRETHGQVTNILDNEVFENVAAVIGQGVMNSYFAGFGEEDLPVAYALQATGLHVVDMGHSFQYRVDPVCRPVVYQGQGHKTRMLAFAFAFTSYEQQGLTLSIANDVVRNEKLRAVWDANKQADWLTPEDNA